MKVPLRPELHTTDRPSSTAQWTTLGRALELHRSPEDRIVSDEYAPVFLSTSSKLVLQQLTLAAPLVHLIERFPLAGVSAFGLCRHRFIDEHLLGALVAGAEQVIILGAGYDTRAYRFADELAGTPVYEVDLPPLSRRKAEIVAGHPELFGHTSIVRVEIDFRTQSLTERLDDVGFERGRTTFVAWEGVSPYLSREAVESTLDALAAACGPGSMLCMDVWRGYGVERHGVLDEVRHVAAQAFALIGEPLTFGVPPRQVKDLLDEHGFDVVDLAEWDELAARYSTDGRPSEESVYVLAAELS